MALSLGAFFLGAGRGLTVPKVAISLIGLGFGLIVLGIVLGGLLRLGLGTLGTNFGTRIDAGLVRPVRLRSRVPDRDDGHNAVPGPARRIRRWPWWIGVSTVVLVGGLGLTGFLVQRSLQRRLTEAVAIANADDPSWQWEDRLLNRHPVADHENSALVVAAALEDLPESWPMERRGPAHQLVATPMSQLYDRIGEGDPRVALTTTDTEILRRSLTQFPEALRWGRTVAGYDRGRHELAETRNLLATPLTETQACRNLARFLKADATLRAQDGDADGSLESSRAILGVARSIGDEPFLISQLVRIAISTVATEAAVRGLAQGQPSDDALAALQNLALKEMAEPLLVHSLRSERAILIELIRRLGQGEMSIDELSDAKTRPPASPSGQVSGATVLFYELQAATGLEWMNQAVFIAQQPLAQRTPLWAAWDAEIHATGKDSVWGRVAILPSLLVPSVGAVEAATLRHQAEMGTLAVLLASERHRLRHGAWPESLKQIDPDLLPQPALDPYTNGPFRLDRRDGRFRVYAVGRNGRDEGGVFDRKQQRTGGPDDVSATAWDVALRRQTPPEP